MPTSDWETSTSTHTSMSLLMVPMSESFSPLCGGELTSAINRVDNDLNCIKGGGACHLREKVLAEAADTWVVVADYRKNSEVLGKTVRTIM